jgi:hypothetical protein
MRGFWGFLSYNNAVPIAISFMLMGAGGVFAATNPDAVYSETETVVRADNTYIANKNLDGWSPHITIGQVTEDAENYYVAFDLATIDIENSVWQDVHKNKVITAAKSDLGQYGDLGLYVTEQLKQVVDAEVGRLRETQQFERREVSQKTVATEYSGLVGRFLDTTAEELPGYVPVVTPPSPTIVQNAPSPGGQVAGASSEAPLQQASASSPRAPVITILGPNPYHLPLGASFADLGASATDDSGYLPKIHRFLNGEEVLSDLLTVDSSTDSEWHITYTATDNDGNSATAERLVIVGKGTVSATEPTPAASDLPSEPTAENTSETGGGQATTTSN